MIALPAILSPAQVENARLILREFALAGYPLGVGIAGVVNAYAESRLDARAVSPGAEDSVGLFQLNSAPRAAGEGMSTAARMNPTTNTRRILEVLRQTPSVMAAHNRGAPVRELSAVFARDVERHGGGEAENQRRRELTDRFFPLYSQTASNRLPSPLLLAPALLPWWVYATGAVLALTSAVALSRPRRSRKRLGRPRGRL